MDVVEWVLNTNDGMDVLHPAPTEVCNTDQAEGRQRIDARTGQAMLNAKTAVLCRHCGEVPTLDVQNHVGD